MLIFLAFSFGLTQKICGCLNPSIFLRIPPQKVGLFAYFIASLSDAAASSNFLVFFCEHADFSGGESEMASLSSPESRIRPAARAGIKNQESAGGGNSEGHTQAGCVCARSRPRNETRWGVPACKTGTTSLKR